MVWYNLEKIKFAGPCKDKNGKSKSPGDQWFEPGCKVAACGSSPNGELFVEITG